MITMLLHAAFVTAVAATTQPPQDGWLAFTGCWRAENAPASSLVCFVPAGDAMRMLEIDNSVTRETRIVADGQQRPLSHEGCTGFESARWSADGERLFLQTQLTCGDHTQRKTSGIFAFTLLSNQWVSIQAVTVGKQGGATTTRYFSVDAAQLPASVAALLPNNRLARETARFAASDPLDFDDIKEALAKVEPRAVEALLIARQQPFDLNGKKLVALADAGIPDYVIDAMVAVSHPEVFEVRTAPLPPESRIADRSFGDTYSLYNRDRYCDSFTYSPWSAYDRYGCRFGYDYYSYMRAGALGYGGYSSWGYYNTPVIIIRDRTSGEPETSGGRAGKTGYTRGSSTGSDHARPRDSGASTSRPASSSTPSSSGSGSSTGSSTSDSGRTAKPRNN